MQDKLNKISNKTTTKYKHLQPRIYKTHERTHSCINLIFTLIFPLLSFKTMKLASCTDFGCLLKSLAPGNVNDHCPTDSLHLISQVITVA